MGRSCPSGFRQAHWFLERGAHRKAASLYRGVLKHNPGDLAARLWLSIALAELGRFDEARQTIGQSTLAARPFFLARVLYDAGEIAQARDLLETCSKQGTNHQALGLRALTFLHAGDAAPARDLFRKPFPQVPWLLGRFLLAIETRLGPPPRELAAQLPVTGLKGSIRRGLVALRLEKWKKAFAAFRNAPAADPRTAFGFGVSLYYLHHLEDAERRLRESLPSLPEQFRGDALATLGKTVLELGRPTEAILLLRQSLSAGGAFPETYYALGLALLQRGRIPLARLSFERCATPEFVLERLGKLRA